MGARREFALLIDSGGADSVSKECPEALRGAVAHPVCEGIVILAPIPVDVLWLVNRWLRTRGLTTVALGSGFGSGLFGPEAKLELLLLGTAPLDDVEGPPAMDLPPRWEALGLRLERVLLPDHDREDLGSRLRLAVWRWVFGFRLARSGPLCDACRARLHAEREREHGLVDEDGHNHDPMSVLPREG